MSHTRFGNSVLAVWADSSRWDSVVKAAYRDGYRWSPASREVWENSFRQWGVVKGELLEHARRICAEFRRPGPGTVAPGDRPWSGYCIKVSRNFVARAGRYAEWVRDVEARLKEVEGAVQRLGALAAQGGASHGDAPFAEDEARGRLLALSEAGRALKLVYSGRGYFNYGDSD